MPGFVFGVIQIFGAGFCVGLFFFALRVFVPGFFGRVFVLGFVFGVDRVFVLGYCIGFYF